MSDLIGICKKCGEGKPLSEFYASRPRTCKPCVRAMVKENREKKPEYYRAFDRQRYRDDPSRKAAVDARRPIYLESGYHTQKNREWRARNPEKYAAHKAVQAAKESGRLVPQPCECGATEVHAHHEDYSKPLEVTWICPACHAKEHVDARALPGLTITEGHRHE